MPKFIRFPEVQAKTGGLARSTIYRLERQGLFPKRRVLTARIVVWVEAEIDAWVLSRKIGGLGLLSGKKKADLAACPV